MAARWFGLPPGAVIARASPAAARRGMNRSEAAFEQQLIASQNYVWLAYEALTLVIAADCRYTPDFAAVRRTDAVLELIEVKGFMRDDARVKLRTAARQFPFEFYLATYSKAGGWTVERVPA